MGTKLIQTIWITNNTVLDLDSSCFSLNFPSSWFDVTLHLLGNKWLDASGEEHCLHLITCYRTSCIKQKYWCLHGDRVSTIFLHCQYIRLLLIVLWGIRRQITILFKTVSFRITSSVKRELKAISYWEGDFYWSHIFFIYPDP